MAICVEHICVHGIGKACRKQCRLFPMYPTCIMRDCHELKVVRSYCSLILWHGLCLPSQGVMHPWRRQSQGLAIRLPTGSGSSCGPRGGRRQQSQRVYARQARLFDLDVQPYTPDSLDRSLLREGLPRRQVARPHAASAQSTAWNVLQEQLTSLRQAAVAVALAGILVAGKDTIAVLTCLLCCAWACGFACMGMRPACLFPLPRPSGGGGCGQGGPMPAGQLPGGAGQVPGRRRVPGEPHLPAALQRA